MRCTGTFYDQWIEEPSTMPPHILISVVCLVITSILIIVTKVVDKKWEQRVHTGPNKRSNTNFVSKNVLILGAIVCIYNISVPSINSQIQSMQINQYPYKIVIPIRQFLVPNIFFATYTFLLISKSSLLKDKIKNSFTKNNVLHPEIIVV